MSTIFRVEKNSNYTVMSNYHMMDYSLSYKAKGILSEILSLPPTWDYTLAGLAALANDGIDSVRSGVQELEDNGYINREQTRDELGRMSKNEYVVFERPEDNPVYMEKKSKKTENPIQLKNKSKSQKLKKGYKQSNSPSLENPMTADKKTDSPLLENPITEKPLSENPMQLNTKELNTKRLSTDISYQSINEPEEHVSESAKLIDRIDKNKISEYKALIYSNIDYGDLIAQNEKDKQRIDEIVDNMLEMMCCKSPSMRIGGKEQPTALVQGRVMKIDSSCIEYILLCLQRNTKKVHNIKAYMQTVIFNAPSTMDNYFDSEVNNALYGQLEEP